MRDEYGGKFFLLTTDPLFVFVLHASIKVGCGGWRVPSHDEIDVFYNVCLYYITSVEKDDDACDCVH
jgi:hypothetical protein